MTSPVIFVLRDPESDTNDVRAFGCDPAMIVEIDLGLDELRDPAGFDSWFRMHHERAHSVAFRNPEAGAWYRDQLRAVRERFMPLG